MPAPVVVPEDARIGPEQGGVEADGTLEVVDRHVQVQTLH
jgi:hypothetical protein